MELEALKIDRGSPRKRRRRSNPWMARVIVSGLVLGALWLFRDPLRRQLDAWRLPTVSVTRVVESRASAAGAVRGTAANGYVVASRRAALSADTPGRIVEINVTEGSVVRQGDVVARLYSEEYEAAAERAEADSNAATSNLRRAEAAIESVRMETTREERNLAVAAAQIQEAEASLRLAIVELERAGKLVAEKISPASELDRAQANHDESQARLSSARSRHAAAQSSLDEVRARLIVAAAERDVARDQAAAAEASASQARATLDKTIVRAPFDGIVVLKDAEVGEVVSPNSQGGSNARGSVCTMVDFGSLEAQVDLPETSLDAARVGAFARVFLDAWPDRPYAGRGSRIWPTADRQKATVEVRVTFDAPDERLRPDMGIRVVFLDEEPAADTDDTEVTAALLVPDTSVVTRAGARGVFVVEGDRVDFRVVETGETRAGRIAIRGGLAGGQTIVSDPPRTLADGDRVHVEEER